MASLELMLPEVPGEHRLGRHIRHDPRSLNFRVLPRGAVVAPKSVSHARRIPILDQGKPISIGSCTCSSAAGVLGSDPFWATLPADLQRVLPGICILGLDPAGSDDIERHGSGPLPGKGFAEKALRPENQHHDQ